PRISDAILKRPWQRVKAPPAANVIHQLCTRPDQGTAKVSQAIAHRRCVWKSDPECRDRVHFDSRRPQTRGHIPWNAVPAENTESAPEGRADFLCQIVADISRRTLNGLARCFWTPGN